MPARFTIACDELRHHYAEEQQGIVALAQHYGCSPTTIAHRLRACGIPVRVSRFQACHVPAEVLTQLYLVEQLPIAEIARRLGVSVSTINNRRRAFGLPIRPRKPTQHTRSAEGDELS